MDYKYVLTPLTQVSGTVPILREKTRRHMTQDLDVNKHRTDSFKTFRTDVY
jgi:hypothetical protein